MGLKLRSENIAGLVSMAGSGLFLLGRDAEGAAITACFLAAELVLTRWGHRRAGYSTGCALFAVGDGVAVTSEVARGNGGFQLALGAMAVCWMIGAARGPLAWLGEKLGRRPITRFADALQPVVGLAVLGLRVPGIVTAFLGASYLGAAAVALWAASDVLIGRLQDIVMNLARTWPSARARHWDG